VLAAVKRLVKAGTAAGKIDAGTAAFKLVDGVKPSALRTRQRAHARTRITSADMRRLCDAPDRATLKGKRDAAILAVLAGSGLRASEVAGLEVGALHKQGKGHVLSILGKGQAESRDALLTREAYGLILEWIAARPVMSQYIFTGFGGRGAGRALTTPMSPSAIWRVVQTYAVAYALEHIKPHDFRRFLGTQLAKSDIRKAQKALGHKSIETTARHYVLDELDEEASEGLY
jgi:integrase/recombinase XerD